MISVAVVADKKFEILKEKNKIGLFRRIFSFYQHFWTYRTSIYWELLSLKIKLASLSKHKIRFKIAVNVSTISKDTYLYQIMYDNILVLSTDSLDIFYNLDIDPSHVIGEDNLPDLGFVIY